MGTSSKQVMDIKVTKGLASVGNEELRDWTEKGWNQAMREGNYDRSREHLNFEIRPGGMVAPIDKSRPLTRRMAENLASRGIKDPNEGQVEPRFRTVVNFIFGGSTERMRELAFGNQKVDFESTSTALWQINMERRTSSPSSSTAMRRIRTSTVRFFLLIRIRSSPSRKSSMVRTA